MAIPLSLNLSTSFSLNLSCRKNISCSDSSSCLIFTDVPNHHPKSYLPEIFQEIWNLFFNKEEEQIINRLKEDPILLDRQFEVSKSWITQRKTIFHIACDFGAEKVITFIINDSRFNYLRSPRNYRLQKNIEIFHQPSPLDDLLDYEDQDKAQFIYSEFLSRDTVSLYTINKRSDFYTIDKGSKKKIISIPLDSIDSYPNIFRTCAEKGKHLIFESILGFYCRQDISDFDSIIYHNTRLPSPIASIILEYSTYVINEKVKEITTLTFINNQIPSYSSTPLNEWNIETPFLWTMYALNRTFLDLKDAFLSLKNYPSNDSLLDKIRNTEKIIRSQIDFAKLLLKCGEDIDRLPKDFFKWVINDFSTHFFENLKIFCTADLIFQLKALIDSMMTSNSIPIVIGSATLSVNSNLIDPIIPSNFIPITDSEERPMNSKKRFFKRKCIIM